MSNRKPLGIKETLTSLMIAFMMAFVFRGFVIEGFIIPTGSMAPTLLGKHIRFTSPYNGYDWTTGPWDYSGRGGSGVPLSRQGAGDAPPLTPDDPITGLVIDPQRDRRLAAGDRVFVLKYLPGLHRPERWDVVVFKNPGDHQNFIKRLVGLPGEQIALVDGDVFARPFEPGQTSNSGPHAWREAGWQIARKSERTQRTMFQPVFDSRFVPINPEPSYRPPLSADGPGASSWSGIQDSRVWTYDAERATSLVWNDRHPITDYYPYNQAAMSRNPGSGRPASNPFVRPSDSGGFVPVFPVSDLAVSIAVEPGDRPVSVTPTITARGFVFQAVIDPAAGRASVRMRPEGDAGAWTELDAAEADILHPGRVTEIEFWHVDQALWLFADGELVAGGPETGAYTLTPAERIAAAMNTTYDDLVAFDREGGNEITRPGINASGAFARQNEYRPPSLRWDFQGGPVTVHRVQVQRDIFYQPRPYAQQTPTRGAHYNNFPTLNGDQFFMLGDNSPNSEDSRYWTESGIDPWVRAAIDPTPGVVNRDLVVGKAFVVYFPAPLSGGPLLAPDFGRLRWIW